MHRSDPNIRELLIAEAFRFIDRVVSISAVRRIAFIGSITSEKKDPKDIDLLVTVDDDADLTVLATAARKLSGVAQSMGKGADVFLANPAGRYIGRICPWRECAPGIRTSCNARHCGRRQFLHDDFDTIKLDLRLISETTIEVWPTVVSHNTVPDDLMSYLSRFCPDTMC